MARLISPCDLKKEYPPHPFPLHARSEAERILLKKDSRLAVIVGPCSIHDLASAREYASRLKKLMKEVKSTLFLVMRVFFEKPRSRSGWKGMLYDPYLDGSDDIEEGLRLSRSLLIELATLGIPCATELLDPLASYYLDDLVSWGLIGARTSASQPHRQMASRLPFPVGFKNDLAGQLEPAISGVLVSRISHSHIGIDPAGHICSIETDGNPLSHIILRGSDDGPNFHPAAVEEALAELRKHHLQPHLLIDCSHGNSGKNLNAQKAAFISVIGQAQENPAIAGVMLESHLNAGKQPLLDDPNLLAYGVSITDPCLPWEETEELLRWADEKLSLGPISMSSVQN